MMADQRLLLLGLVLLAAGCEQSGYSGTSHTVKATALQDESAQPAVVEETAPATTPAETAVASEATPPAPAAEESPPLHANDGSANPERKSLPIKNITFDDIKFEIEKDSKFEPSMLTPKIEELVGRKVRVRGFILPGYQQTLRAFILTRDNQSCCFGPGAAIYDCIAVHIVPPETTQFTILPVTAEGLLTLRETVDFDGITRTIYHLDATSVR